MDSLQCTSKGLGIPYKMNLKSVVCAIQLDIQLTYMLFRLVKMRIVNKNVELFISRIELKHVLTLTD